MSLLPHWAITLKEGQPMNHLPDLRWARIQELFDRALTWPPSERLLRLSELEPKDDVRSEVLMLLAASEAEEAESRRLQAKLQVPSPAAPLPESVGPYRVVDLAGAGGRGRVFEAMRESSAGPQRVAVKVMLEHLIAPEDLARFEREQRALVGLDHPGIARFLDAGWDSSLGPFLAMEWVDGLPIDEYCSRHATPRADRVRLIIAVLDALHAAHRSLVVHLDIKPSNVLVDSAGRARVLDFGAAKLIEQGDPTSTQQLTPRYSSPEQLRGEPVTTACDLYATGLLLHELVTGRLPWLDGTSIASMAERATGAASLRIATGEKDLDAVLKRALEFDARQRYGSAAEFADDLRALLDRRPVSARPPTVWYRLNRLAARNPLASGIAAASALALTVTVAYAAWQQLERNREAVRTRQIADFLRSMVTTSAVASSGRPAMTVIEMVERASRRLSQGMPLPVDVAANLQADFAYVTQEYGREDLAEPLAKQALAWADQGGRVETRLQARSTLATIHVRRGQCGQASELMQTGDSLLARSPKAVPPAAKASYLLARANVSETCEGKLQEAIRLAEQSAQLLDEAAPERFLLPPAVSQAAARLTMALLLARAGRTDDSLRVIADALKLAASHPDGRYLQQALLRMRSQTYAVAGKAREALADIEEAARISQGIVNPFESIRLRTLIASRTFDAGDRTAALAIAKDAVQAARDRRAEVGPSFWMILADAAEAMAKASACEQAMALYREVDSLTGGKIPRTWRGNRLFYEAECTVHADADRAAALAREALQTYGELLPSGSKRRARLDALTAARP
jgi:serine/threonine-protein kinase